LQNSEFAGHIRLVFDLFYFFLLLYGHVISARARPEQGQALVISTDFAAGGCHNETKQRKEGLGRVAVTRSFDIFDLSYLIFRCLFTMSALERSRRLVTTFVALILYSTSAWRLRQLNRLMNPKKQKKLP
jgi:hypothetical protein